MATKQPNNQEGKPPSKAALILIGDH